MRGTINLTNPVKWNNPLNRGLVAWWDSLPGVTWGNRLWDISNPGVSGYEGTLTNISVPGTSTSGWGPGQYGGFGAIQYAGTDDVVYFGDLSSHFTTDQATIHFVVKRTLATPAGNPDAGFCLFGADVTDNGTHYPYSNGLVYSNIFRSSGNRVNALTPLAGVDRTQWHLLSVTTKNGTGTYTVYQNAQVMGTANGEASVTMPPSASLGRSISTQDNWFIGWFGSVYLANRCWSYSEVQRFHYEWQAGFPSLLNRRRLIAKAPAAPAGGTAFNASWARNSNIFQGVGGRW